MAAKKLILIILDGWGIGDGSKADAIANSKTPFYNYLLNTFINIININLLLNLLLLLLLLFLFIIF